MKKQNTVTLSIPFKTWERIQALSKKYQFMKLAEFGAYAINYFIDYCEQNGSIPMGGVHLIDTPKNTQEFSKIASDLPGMTPEVIQSHLVRFPKVTPEAYKGIIEELRARQNSEEGLKNPEAAAYGLCKRIQNGQSRAATTPQEQHQAQPATDNPIPDDVLGPFFR